MIPTMWEKQFSETIDALRAKNLFRALTPLDAGTDTSINIHGKKLLAFCSNNYLGLANHPKLKAAAIDAVQTWGVGAGASRLVSGNLRLYEALEEKIAVIKSCEKALVFNSGYTANIGILGALIGENDLVLFDRLNHASLIDGVKLSRGKLRVYRHKDMEQVQSLLSRRAVNQKAIIVTDGIFSMDGDIAPLPEMVALANQYDAVIYLDDAHATGVLGEHGRGTYEHFHLHSERIIQMGTLSKALGGFGGFVAGSALLILYLVNKARSLIYTTALPPSVLATALTALILIEEEKEYREKLWVNANYFRKSVMALGYNTCGSETPIVPLLIGEADYAVVFSKRLMEEGIYVPAIRPPTVPKGQSRLRITLMATHTKEQIDFLILKLKEIGSKLGVL
jgi:8-amino-7-oxononanoate synthase